MARTKELDINSKPIAIIRPGLKRLCDADACRAALFNQLLYCISWKIKGQPVEDIQRGEVYWYGTAEEISHEQLDDSWGVSKVRKEIKELVKSGMMGQRRNPRKGFDQTRHYSFGAKECAVFLEACKKQGVCLYCLDFPSAVLHLIKTSNGNDESIKCICANHQMHLINLPNAFDKSNNAIPEDTTEDTRGYTQRENVDSVSADAENATPSPAFSAESHESEETQPDQQQEAASHPIATKAPPAPSEGDVPPPSQKARRARGSLKPRASKKTISPEMQARINAVFDCFDEVAQEVTGDPAFRHARHQTSTQHIRDLLEGRTITREMLKDVYQELWNRPAGTNGFRWRDHMSIKAVCNNFDVTWLAIEATRAKKAKRQMPPDNVLPFPKPEEASSPRILTRSEREAILHPQGRVGAR